jgi:16S rRNA (guanine1516-N2)-methyltransferase
MHVACVDKQDNFSESIARLASELHFPLITSSQDFSAFDYLLGFNDGALQLLPCDKQKGGALLVDFDSAAMEYRRTSSGIQQDIAKAVGCKHGYRPNVLDVTAGLSGDAFILASLGCTVTLVENNPVIYAMLADGIKRALALEHVTADIVRDRMHLLPRQDALVYLASMTPAVDVVYLDPMFPERQKSAKVKKAMQYFHEIVGCYHEQESLLLDLAFKKALKRVVVKRPKLAPLLDNKKPSYQVKGKSVRYDIYLCSTVSL